MATDHNLTTRIHQLGTIELRAAPRPPGSVRIGSELSDAYDNSAREPVVQWIEQYQIRRLLGAGGQGVVFLADRLGDDDFSVPVALKFFSPKQTESKRKYDREMNRIAKVASRLGVIQQDHLLDVDNFVDINGERVMVMEWIDGFDLEHLLDPATLEQTRCRACDEQWSYLNKVVFSLGPARGRLMPGIANAIVRDCLAALSSLHRAGIVHADIKPSNIMVKRTGNAKVIDLGAAFEICSGATTPNVTPRYAAPEVLLGEPSSPASDLTSLGYVLIEMLSGVPIFAGLKAVSDLLRAKQRIMHHVHEIMPRNIVQSELLLDLIRGLVSPDPVERFPSAEAADLFEYGAASFNRQLVTGDLSSEYEADLRTWLSVL